MQFENSDTPNQQSDWQNDAVPYFQTHQFNFVGDGIDYPKFNGFRIRISHENCTFWRYDPNLKRPSGYSTNMKM